MNQRLQRLREVLKLEWGELATHLGMSRAMLDFVRNGQRNLGFPALRRLEQAEKEAGIVPTVDAPLLGKLAQQKKMTIRETVPAYGDRDAEMREAIRLIRDGLEMLERSLGERK